MRQILRVQILLLALRFPWRSDERCRFLVHGGLTIVETLAESYDFESLLALHAATAFACLAPDQAPDSSH
jgi:hypothetical protein